jgi:hypothetical protein
MAERRELRFASLDDVMPEVDKLLAGHVTVGGWSLGQICNHVATAIRITLDAPIRRTEVTPEKQAAHRLFLEASRFPDGMQAPLSILVPPTGLDDRAEAESLRSVIDRFQPFDGPLPSHPKLGPMTKDEWVRFHVMHCAHHLGFAVPQ